ncbi:MAG: SCP2 sterol-binding domain-containing protein [Acidobacteria bacterium]|nr:SCP2 sterol-binding domain-containing protein [Acidobacteriota bacterium]
MMQLAEHPTVKRFYELEAASTEPPRPAKLDPSWLRQLCLEAGADDAGFVEMERPEIADQREDILAAFPRAKTLVSFVCRMNRENIRTPARSIANLEFHHTGDEVNEVARKIVAALDREGVRAMNGGSMGFPMEMDRFPGKLWVVSHKPVAVAAGLGAMGIHRNIIHPQFGNFILLGTVVMDAEVQAAEYSRPVDYNPCLECKLCVAACPVGAISSDGQFNFSACYTHNYREFMGGFTDWVENIADSKNARDYRAKVSDPETVSMWQSLSFGANYKAAYCLSVCPAGDDVIAPFLTDRKQYLQEVVRPLQAKEETVYVVPGSDAEAYVPRRFPHKKIKQVGNGLRPRTIRGFLSGLRLVFERNQSEGLNATYHFTFTGEEEHKATVTIRNKRLQVADGHEGSPDLRVTADSRTWLRFLAKEENIVWALLRRKIRLRGSPRLLLAFGRCFPS